MLYLTSAHKCETPGWSDQRLQNDVLTSGALKLGPPEPISAVAAAGLVCVPPTESGNCGRSLPLTAAALDVACGAMLLPGGGRGRGVATLARSRLGSGAGDEATSASGRLVPAPAGPQESTVGITWT